MIFDTHQFIKRMTDAGFTPTQAEALCDERIKLINNNLATNQDIPASKRDFQELRLAIEQCKVDVELSISKGFDKIRRCTLLALLLAFTFLTVFFWLLLHFNSDNHRVHCRSAEQQETSQIT